MRSRVTLTFVTASIEETVRTLAPTAEQEAFSGRADEALDAAESDPTQVPCAVLHDGRPVGFFVLDSGPRVEGYRSSPRMLGVRAFFIAGDDQGRGHGGAAVEALSAFVRSGFPWCTGLRLTVNQRNAVALHTYLAHGFRDTGEVYRGGPAGPQQVLEMPIAR